jgi:hypothetical protein
MLFFKALSLYLRTNSGIFEDIWGENKLQLSFQMDCKWVHHDYGCRGVVEILTMDAYLRMDLCTSILFGWDWQQVFHEVKIDLKNSKTQKMTHPLTKLNKNKSYYVDKYFGFDRNVYVVEELFYFNSEQSHNQGIVELTLTTVSLLPTT